MFGAISNILLGNMYSQWTLPKQCNNFLILLKINKTPRLKSHPAPIILFKYNADTCFR